MAKSRIADIARQLAQKAENSANKQSGVRLVDSVVGTQEHSDNATSVAMDSSRSSVPLTRPPDADNKKMQV